MQAKYDAKYPAALKQLVAGGTKLHRFPADFLDAAFKESMALYGDLENLWFRFAEAGLDDFMQTQKL